MSELQDYINSEDPNYFWRLSSGQHENLLDASIEYGEMLEARIAELEKALLKAADDIIAFDAEQIKEIEEYQEIAKGEKK